ncbi:MAG: hypothetical protein WAN04_13510 [Candidatus Udaeobacter sp.]
MKASATNSLTSGPHTEIDDISYHDVVAAENRRASAHARGNLARTAAKKSLIGRGKNWRKSLPVAASELRIALECADMSAV